MLSLPVAWMNNAALHVCCACPIAALGLPVKCCCCHPV